MYPKEMWCVKEMKMTKNVRGSERIEVESGKKKIVLAKCASCGKMKAKALPRNLFYKCKE